MSNNGLERLDSKWLHLIVPTKIQPRPHVRYLFEAGTDGEGQGKQRRDIKSLGFKENPTCRFRRNLRVVVTQFAVRAS